MSTSITNVIETVAPTIEDPNLQLILRIRPDNSVDEKKIDASKDDAGLAPDHSNDTLMIQFINIPGKESVLVLVRKAKMYEDINVAANYLQGTTNQGIKHMARMIPPAYFDFVTLEDRSNGKQRVYVETKCTKACEHSLHRNLPEDVDIGSRIIPVEVEAKRSPSERVAAVYHPLSLRRRPTIYAQQKEEMLKEAAKKAHQDLSNLYHAEMNKRNVETDVRPNKELTEDDRNRVAKVDQILSPLLNIPRGQFIPENVMEPISEFINHQLSDGQYRQALMHWASRKLQERDPTEIWPIIRFLVNQSDKAVDDAIAVETLTAVSEDEEEKAFEITPSSLEEMPWAQCDCCQKWRVLKQPLTEEEEKESWFCHSAAGGGMDIRNMPQKVQDVVKMLNHVREKLRYTRLPAEERKTLQMEEKELCNMMCDVPAEEESEALMRLEPFANRVVDNPVWTNLMAQYDAEQVQKEQGENALRYFISSNANVGTLANEKQEEDEDRKPFDKLDARQQASLIRLTQGVGAEEDRKMLETGELGNNSATTYIGGKVRDDIDFVEDIIQGRAQEIRDIEIQLHRISALEKEITEKQSLIIDLDGQVSSDTRKTDIAQQLLSLRGDLQLSIAELEELKPRKAALGEELAKLMKQQNEDRLRVETLRGTRERDPMIPQAVKQGEQNEVYVIRALAQLAQGATHGYIVHYGRDVEPIASELRTEALGSDFGKTGKDVVFALLDPDKYQFLGARKTPLGSATIKLRKGYFLLRSKIQQANDVDRAMIDVQTKLSGLLPEYFNQVREQLETVYEENRVLPYVLGGAFGVLVEAELKEPNVTDAQQQELLKTRWHIGNDVADLIVKQFKLHVQKVMNQTTVTKSRADALKVIKTRASALEAMRVSGIVPKGSKIPWWTVLNFPVIPPYTDTPPSTAAHTHDSVEQQMVHALSVIVSSQPSPMLSRVFGLKQKRKENK